MSTTTIKFAVYRSYQERPGCVDFLGTVPANTQSEAYDVAMDRWGAAPGEELMIQVDDEDNEQGD